MAKATSGKAAGKVSGRAAAPAAEAAPAPRLVETDKAVPLPGDDAGGSPPEPAQGDAQIERLAAFLLARPGFDTNGGGAGDAAIRVIRDLDGAVDTWRKLAEDGDAHLARYDKTLLKAIDMVSPPFEAKDGEAIVDAAARALAEQDLAAQDYAREIATLTADPAKAAQIEARKAHAKAERGEVAVLADLPDSASLTLRFAEDDGRFIAAIAPIAIERHELSAFGGRGVLERVIDFPVETPPALIRSAWLIAGAKAVKCEISGGLRVGGGHVARIPKGHLIF